MTDPKYTVAISATNTPARRIGAIQIFLDRSTWVARTCSCGGAGWLIRVPSDRVSGTASRSDPGKSCVAATYPRASRSQVVAVVDPELLHTAVQMCLDGPHRDDETIGDLSVTETLTGEFDQLRLAWGEIDRGGAGAVDLGELGTLVGNV